ncbi:CREB3 regulatory factor-like isoform X3 [Brienomyrus brachyistius]|uniref:CREB3 regulatory factor-like isoform X3 n=1 Tax=Brienomyrus brachyistius TaxID=42636 RepID=UPI0020B2392F|nr:CREB3 regulatory factor-like isoform X3 [Brienomyrus brachyistius]
MASVRSAGVESSAEAVGGETHGRTQAGAQVSSSSREEVSERVGRGPPACVLTHPSPLAEHQAGRGRTPETAVRFPIGPRGALLGDAFDKDSPSSHQPSITGMDPPFGDAFESYTFADQALTSTDLLVSGSEPDFMYELDTEMTRWQSPGADVSLGDSKEIESVGQLAEILDGDPNCNSSFEQWDTYWEDLTKYTKLTSCDIWGTKEVDFLGLDDFSSPYQDEEVISKTPTLAQLNSEDSQPVCDTLYHPDLLQIHKTPSLPLAAKGKKAAKELVASGPSSAKNLLPDYAEGSQKATWPVPSCTETMSKAQTQVPKAVPVPSEHNKDYVRKAKVRVNMPCRPAVDFSRPQTDLSLSPTFVDGGLPPSSPPSTPATAPTVTAAAAGTIFSASRMSSCASGGEVKLEKPRLEVDLKPESGITPLWEKQPSFPAEGGSQAVIPTGSLGAEDARDKGEEHNYSLFTPPSKPSSKDELEEGGAEEEELEDLEEVELDDEDHDEGFGSEHEFSENEEEEEDFEDEKDDEISDSFSEPGCDHDAADDVKALTSGLLRKRGKRRYFWEYSEQLTAAKHERVLKPSEWDRDTLPSNMYQKNGLHPGKHAVKKSRRTDVEDLTPNPRKLLQIGSELHKLNKVISDLTPVSELPLTARPRSRKEKNKLASRACRLKKKAQYEANKVKLWGLSTEYDRLLFVINGIKEEIVNRVQSLTEDKASSMTDKLNRLIEETLVSSRWADI